ncbi:MAG: bifunctional N-acetylglucosamine-1-phosphate uridyltransferase/glucosamine-1-phosphate acetyltransferase, partial [Polyangiales bacterium]
KVLAVREDADCAPHERDIGEINPGVYWVAVDFLLDEIGYLDDTNAQGEFYLTDLVASAARRGGVTAVGANFADLQGVNDRYELSLADRRLQQRLVADWARRGVFFRDPASVWLDASVSLEAGAEIGPQVHLRGRTHVSAGAIVDVGCVLEGVSLGPDVRLAPYTVARDSELAEGASAGPFTHLRPGSELAARAKVGNFVEMKQTRLGPGSKASHLSYLGDGVVGAGVNIGAGTIFCNYDGAQKHRTVLEDGVFVGSDSQLVAPVRVGQGAYIATGTTVTRDVSADALAISRPKQDNKEGYAKRLRAAQAARVKKTSEGE